MELLIIITEANFSSYHLILINFIALFTTILVVLFSRQVMSPTFPDPRDCSTPGFPVPSTYNI